jgi:hypothetical protein
MFLKYDEESDALSVRFFEDGRKSARTERLDWRRMVDYDRAGEPIGFKLLNVSDGNRPRGRSPGRGNPRVARPPRRRGLTHPRSP